MTDTNEQFRLATSLTDDLDLVVDPDGLPEFDTRIHQRTDVASELGSIIGRSIKAQAELRNSAPVLIAARSRHVAKVEASLERATDEEIAAYNETLRHSPRAAALLQVADNELDASLQLQRTTTSILEDLTAAFGSMNDRLAVFDVEAQLALVDGVQPSWSTLARHTISWYLSDK